MRQVPSLHTCPEPLLYPTLTPGCRCGPQCRPVSQEPAVWVRQAAWAPAELHCVQRWGPRTLSQGSEEELEAGLSKAWQTVSGHLLLSLSTSVPSGARPFLPLCPRLTSTSLPLCPVSHRAVPQLSTAGQESVPLLLTRDALQHSPPHPVTNKDPAVPRLLQRIPGVGPAQVADCLPLCISVALHGSRVSSVR